MESEEVELGDRRDEIKEGEDGDASENEDAEALDSDDEQENEELQIDSEQSDSASNLFLILGAL